MTAKQSKLNKNYKVYRNVSLGRNAQIGYYVVIGVPPKGLKEGELKTIIGIQAVIRSHTVIYAGNKIGDNFQTGHNVLIREKNRIGNNVSIGSHSVIEHDVEIADNVRMHSQVFIPEFSILEDGCWIGPNVVLTNAYHPLCPVVKKCLKGPTIGKGAKVGANATLLPDIVIGEYALVGAGSVVVDNVPPRMVVVGNPAKVIKSIEELTCPYGLIEGPYKDR
jgi:acetyltransferase-like isoleucine patch superfamily enzyme